MPKINDYPQASFNKSFEVAEAVDALGGNCSVEICANKLGKQPTSGGFAMIIGSASKYGLIENRRGYLSITDRYRQIKLAYTQEEKNQLLLKSFLAPPVFRTLYDRFKGKELPLSLLSKMLIREFNVEENAASRVSGYFIEGAKQMSLLDSSGALIQTSETQDNENGKESINENDDQNKSAISDNNSYASKKYVVAFKGPELNHSFSINDDEDFEMIEVLLKKIRKALKTKEGKGEI